MTAPIKYPDSWGPGTIKAMQALLAQARETHKVLLCRDLLCTPDEIESEQLAGRLFWSADNWELVPIDVPLAQAEKQMAELREWIEKLHKIRDGSQ